MKSNKAKSKAAKKKAAKPVDVYEAMVRRAEKVASAAINPYHEGIAFKLSLAAMIAERQSDARDLSRALGLTSGAGETMTFSPTSLSHSAMGRRSSNRTKGK